MPKLSGAVGCPESYTRVGQQSSAAKPFVNRGASVSTQKEKAEAFRTLHAADEPFVIPNPWDAGSASLLENAGFRALATTSAGFAQTMARSDGQVTLEEKLRHCRELSAATTIPISADFENGFADAPADVAANLMKVAEAGVVGASIEDYSAAGIYDFGLAVERVAAAVEAAAALPFPFTLTARAEGLLRQVGDLDDAIKRLQAFEAAGADVLYAPGLADFEQVKTVMESVSRPVNVLAAFMPHVSMADYAALGVRRISLGSALGIHANNATRAVAKQMLDSGTFDWL
jgi:2-methylisocitrate lyase-like PEP mutase family enzyme